MLPPQDEPFLLVTSRVEVPVADPRQIRFFTLNRPARRYLPNVADVPDSSIEDCVIVQLPDGSREPLDKLRIDVLFCWVHHPRINGQVSCKRDEAASFLGDFIDDELKSPMPLIDIRRVYGKFFRMDIP